MLCTQLTARLVKWRSSYKSFWLEWPQPPWEPTQLTARLVKWRSSYKSFWLEWPQPPWEPTQLTARLVKWRSSYKSFWLEWPQPPWEFHLSLLEGTLTRVPLARNHLVSSFMHGAKRLRPVRPPSFTYWDLSVVLKGLLEPPFEPLESAPVRILTLKVTLLLALCWQVFWSVMGQVWQRVSLACVVYRSHCVKLRSVELPMKENVLGYLHNPCSPSRERDAASAAKLLLLSTCFFDRKFWRVRWRERGSMSNTYGVPVAQW